MKLLESINDEGGTIQDAIQKMVNDMFREELDDDVIEGIVEKLSLSDIIALDKAYTDGDRETVQQILGPMPQLEYSMGAGRQASSSASSRPAPAQQGGSAAAKKPGTQNTTQTNRNYSDGVKNGVTTQNTDDENNPDAVMQDEEPIEEAGTYSPFKHDDDVIVVSGEWEGETGIVVKTGDFGVTVQLYNHDHMLDFQPDELDINEYAGSGEEENDMRNMYGDDEFDRMNGDYDEFDESVDKYDVSLAQHVLDAADDAGVDLGMGIHDIEMELESHGITDYTDALAWFDSKDAVGEAGAPDYNPAKGGYNREDEMDTQYAVINYPDTSVSYIIRRPHEDWQHIYDPSYGYEGPVDDMDLEMARPLDYEDVPTRLREGNTTNVVQMTEWLKRRAGIV